MFKKLFVFICTVSLALILAACGSGTVVTSGGGSAPSDGGTTSAKYAGTYTGTINVDYEGADISSGSDSADVTIVVGKDGKVTLTSKDEVVNGVISGNSVYMELRLSHKQTGADCSGIAKVSASINDNVMSGPVSGGANCTILGVNKTSATLSGQMRAVKQ